jgi:uncharacterized protein (DUF169 family)
MLDRNQQAAAALMDGLELDRQPVGLAFLDAPPAGVASTDALPPTACTFWRLGERSLFYAEASRHFDCPVGTIAMGWGIPPERQAQAEQVVGTMIELGYVSADEVAHVPAVERPGAGILYGPLAQFPIEPKVVLAITSPFQAMLLAEADEAVKLGRPSLLPTLGRPACGAVAWSANEATTVMSVGCIGARTHLDLPADRAVVIIPGERLDGLVRRLPTIVRANEALAAAHQAERARFEAAAGGAPTPTG